MKNFLCNNKGAIFQGILFILYFVFIFLTWGKWGNIIADSFREAIIPQAMIDGKVLYSDITNLYPSFAYQINAFIFSILGNSLNVLYGIAIIISAFILASLYKTIKLYASDLTAFLTVLFIMQICTFRISPLNSASWFFPYSYSFLYAFAFCIFSVLFYFLYKKYQKQNFLFISIFSTGLSVAFKYDFLLIGLIPFFEVIKSKSIKNIITSTMLFILPTAVSFCLWFISGGSVDILKNQMAFLSDFSKSPSLQIFNKTLPCKITFKILNQAAFSGFEFFKNIFSILIFSHFSIVGVTKISNKFLKILLSFILFIIGGIVFIPEFVISQISKFSYLSNFVFVQYFVWICAISIICKNFKQKKYSEKEVFYLLISAFAFLMTIRQTAAIYLSYIGNFNIILYFTAFIFFIFELLPEYFDFFKKKNVIMSIFISFIVFSSTFAIVNIDYSKHFSYPISSDKGVIYASEATLSAFKQAIDYANQNISKEHSVLVLEEGLILNYFTGLKTNLKYYALIPHMVDTFGEHAIIKEFEVDPPDYIFITNNRYFGTGYFGIDYAKNIVNYIFDNYEFIKSFLPSANGMPSIEITLFRKKNIT